MNNVNKGLAKVTGHSSAVVALRVVLNWGEGSLCVDQFLNMEGSF